MKENRYDETIFFEKYSEMERSKKGLEGAGEWKELEKMLPAFEDRDVLDLGCGYGWHCAYAAEKGARSVLGTDISARMLEVAEQKNSHKRVRYVQCAMEDLKLEKTSFDIILSSLAFHYVKDFSALVSHIREWIKPGGIFVFSVEHPVFTARGDQDWHYDAQGNIQHFPVDNYYYEGKREAVFLGEKVIKYHRTLTTYMDVLLDNGFEILKVTEPMPPDEMMEIPGMKDEMRRPMMLLIKAKRKETGI